MTDYLEILPSFTLTQPSPSPGTESKHEAKKAVHKKSRYTGFLPVRTLSEIIRGANQLFLPLKNPEADLGRAKARKLEEQRQILGLRMKNVSSSFDESPFVKAL